MTSPLPGRFVSVGSGSLAVIATVIGMAGAAGQLLGIPWLAGGTATLPPIRFNAAALIVLAGLAILMLRRPAGRWTQAAIAAAASMIVLVGIATVAEWRLGMDLGIDRLIVARPIGEAFDAVPGRMSLFAAFSLTMLGIGIWLALGSGRRAVALAEAVTLSALGSALFVLIGHLLGAAELQAGGEHRTDLSAGLGVMALSLSLLLHRPDWLGGRLLADPHSSSRMGRVIGLSVVAIPFVAAGLQRLYFSGDIREPYLLMVASMLAMLFLVAASVLTLRAVGTAERSRESAVIRSDAIFEAVAIPMAVVEFAGNNFQINPAAQRLFGVTEGSSGAGELLGAAGTDSWLTGEMRALVQAALPRVMKGERVGLPEVTVEVGSGRTVTLLGDVVPIRGQGGVVEGMVISFVDLTEERRLGRERHLLATAIEQAAESVVITDVTGGIQYVNPAFERITGYTRDEIIGANPRILKSGAQSAGFYQAMWATLTSGESWVADFINRRKDGSQFLEEAVVSPVRDASGVVVNYIAVKRDVTAERRAEARSAALLRERAMITETIRGLPSGATLQETANTIVRQLASLTSVRMASLLVYRPRGDVEAIAVAVEGASGPAGIRLPRERSREIRARAAQGAWIEPTPLLTQPAYAELASRLGLRTAVLAPMRGGDQVIGVITVHSTLEPNDPRAAELLPSLVEFAELATILVGPQLQRGAAAAQERKDIQRIIGSRRFTSVFQPIVELRSGRVIGYEALTRFENDWAPSAVFDEARRLGLGSELEIVTLREAVRAAADLPGRGWVALNVSPELVLAREPLRTAIGALRRPLILEITENMSISDYAAFAAAVASLGRTVRLAVDDAGAGFASLRHVLDLRPSLIKLDRSLISQVDFDPAREAMIAGLGYYTRVRRARLLAEGIETEAELRTLRVLGVPLGQGFLLGRPGPAGEQPIRVDLPS